MPQNVVLPIKNYIQHKLALSLLRSSPIITRKQLRTLRHKGEKGNFIHFFFVFLVIVKITSLFLMFSRLREKAPRNRPASGGCHLRLKKPLQTSGSLPAKARNDWRGRAEGEAKLWRPSRKRELISGRVLSAFVLFEVC